MIYGEANAKPEPEPPNIDATCTKAFEPKGVPREVAKAAAGPLVNTLDNDDELGVNADPEANPLPIEPACV